MQEILLSHARRYPRMMPQDAVKLIYQSEFGGGHLIQDNDRCVQYLYQEYSAITQHPGIALLEDIGSGMVRVQLAALDAFGYSPEQLGQDFIRSATRQWGSRQNFTAKLEILRQLAADGTMPFSCQALNRYLSSYAAAGFPVVSHSTAYRSAYQPAYRVLASDCLPEYIAEYRKL